MRMAPRPSLATSPKRWRSKISSGTPPIGFRSVRPSRCWGTCWGLPDRSERSSRSRPSRRGSRRPPSTSSTRTRSATSITSRKARASWTSSWRFRTRSASAGTTPRYCSSNSGASVLIFLSDFLNAEVVDVRQHRIGRVRDLVVVMTEPFPRVTGVILKGNRRVRSIDWAVVRSWDNKELSLKVDEASVQPHAHVENEMWLSRQVLDKQIVDMDGRRVVRVNDLQLSQVEGSLLLVGVDIGSRGLARRVGLEGLGRRVASTLHLDWPQKLISWEAVDPVSTAARAVHMRIAHTTRAKLHPADIAEHGH